MVKLYDETMTATQVAVAKEYRASLREYRKAEQRHDEAAAEWHEAKVILEPRLAELRQGLRELGLEPDDFDGAS